MKLDHSPLLDRVLSSSKKTGSIPIIRLPGKFPEPTAFIYMSRYLWSLPLAIRSIYPYLVHPLADGPSYLMTTPPILKAGQGSV